MNFLYVLARGSSYVSVRHIILISIALGIVLVNPSALSAQTFNPDTTFGAQGLVKTIQAPLSATATSIAVQPDGKIIASGFANNAQAQVSFFVQLIRYNPDGSIDSSFGVNGITSIAPGYSDAPFSLLIQPDNKILVGGQTHLASNPSSGGEHSFVIRYNPDGTLDSTFGNGGIRIIIIPETLSDAILALALQPDGRIVAGATTDDTSYGHFAIIRLLPDGSADSSFGTNGYVLTAVDNVLPDTTNTGSTLSDILIQPDGKIVAGGMIGIYDNMSLFGDYKFALARYNQDGSPDNTFGTGGLVITSFDPLQDNDDIIRKIALQPDGKIVAAGTSDALGLPHLTLLRYNTDGSLDPGFGSGGKILDTTSNQATAMLIQPDGRILVTWNDPDGNNYAPNIGISAFLPDGSKDHSMGPDGKKKFDLGSDLATSWCIIRQPDDKIVIGGASKDTVLQKQAFTILRLVPDSSTLDIPEDIIPANNSISIFPNPASAELTVEYQKSNPGKTVVTIKDVLGRTVLRQNALWQNIGLQKLKLDVSGLKPGLYWITVSDNEKRYSRKLMIAS